VIQRRGISILHAALRSMRTRVVNGDLLPPGLDDPAFDDHLKALFGALSTWVLMLIVIVISTAESVFLGHTQISLVDLAIFVFAGFAIAQWLLLRGTTDRFGALLLLFAAVVRVPDRQGDLGSFRGPTHGRIGRALGNLWIPVTFQFALAHWLIYASGGVMNSPYTAVPAVMMLIGQSVYPAPLVELPKANARELFKFCGRFARYYAYPFCMLVSMQAIVVLLQERYPLVTRPAPPFEIVLTTLVAVFSGYLVAHVTRRAADRPVARTPSS
jgi:hypothetical protein